MLRLIFSSPTSSTLAQARGACRRYFADAALFSAVVNILYLAPSIYMLQVYDRALPARSGATLAMLTGMFLLAVMTSAALDLLRARLLVRAGERLDHQLARPIMDRLLSARRSEAATAAVLRDFDAARQTLTGAGVMALFDTPWAPIYLVICFLVHPALGALALIGGALLILLSVLNGRATAEPARRALSASQTHYGAIDEMLRGREVAVALGMADGLATRALRHRSESARLQTVAGFTAATYVSITKAARLALQSLALGLGAWLAIRGSVSAGAIFASSLLMARALQPIELVTATWRGIVQSRATYETLDALLAREDSVAPPALPEPTGQIRVEELRVVADPNKPAQAILHGIDFSVEAGEMIVVAGASGSGKSTLLRALAGAIEPQRGSVRLDGADLAHWPVDQRRRAIGYLPQSPTLFRGTLRENIARFDTELADPASTDAGLVRAAQAAGIHDVILRFPQGYDTVIGDGGVTLSAGQAQRVALARALYGDPCVMILDEPNASLDAEGEACLDKAIRALRARKATVIVALHHGSLIAAADRLLVMRDGRIERIGQRTDVADAA